MHLTAGREALWTVLVGLALVITMLLSSSSADAASGKGPSYKVAGVSDGDTIRVVVGKKTERVRLIGIDTPELGRNGSKDQCHARTATREMQKLAQGKRVHLVRDKTQSNRDKYGRLLRYVYTDKRDRDVAKVLITQGHGRQYTYGRSIYQHRAAYIAAEDRAKKAKRGLWKSCADPGSGQTAAPPVAAPVAEPGTCLIKGNIASSGEKIYHVPGQEHYDETRINGADGERWFCSEPEAVAAGWRRSLN